MSVLWYAIVHDWAVLSPIVICSVVCLGVAIERIWFYRRNRGPSSDYVRQLQRDLERGLDAARATANQHHGITGEVSADAIGILATHPERFDTMFDVTVSLAMRELDRNLAILGTIATVSPYLGLFGTVVRILLTFGEMARMESGGETSQIMFGIGSALICTAVGLGVAIVAVALNNYFRTQVERYAGDFEVLKLTFMSAAGALPRPPRAAYQTRA
jgi:biopolymer transport protein ExbB